MGQDGGVFTIRLWEADFLRVRGPLNDTLSYEAQFFSLTNFSFEALGLLLGSESVSSIVLLLPVKSRAPLTTLYTCRTATSLLKHRVLGLPVLFLSWQELKNLHLEIPILVEFGGISAGLESSWRLQLSLRT